MLARFQRMIARIAAMFHASSLDRDLNDELESHVALLAEDYRRQGMTPGDAERSARLKLGGVSQIVEGHRETRGLPFIDRLRQDTRYAFRTLRRDAGFTVFAILVAGLGVGAVCMVFSVVNALLLRPLPLEDSRHLVWIANGDEDNASHTTPVGPFLDLRSQTHTFSDIAAYYAFYGIGDKKINNADNSERLTGVPVSFNFFSLLGVQPRLGRSFSPAECRANQPVVLLSDDFWKRHFGSDPSVMGRKLRLDDQLLTVIGVLPASFDFGSLFAPGSRIDLFLPLPLTPDMDRMGDTLALIGRLKPSATLRQAQAEAAILSEPIRRQHSRDALSFRLQTLDEHVRGRLRPGLLVLAFAVGAVMLIVCANLSNLQLARAATRQKEFAIRVALGAGRARLIRQMLTESLLLSAGGTVLGLVLAAVGTRLIASLTSIVLPLRESIHLDGHAVAFTSVVALLTGIVLGLVPALRVPDVAVHESLKDAGRGSSEGRHRHGIRAMLVVSEIAFACVLLVAAGLLIRSFLRVLDVDLGFRPERAAVIRIDPGARYSTKPARDAYFGEVLRAVRSIPGVTSAGLTDVLPFGHDRAWNAGRKDRVYSRSHPPPDAFPRIVSDGYFEAMGIPLRAGRYLTEQDNAAGKPVIVINQTVAHTLWPDRDAIGQTLIGTDVDREVVGVVGDVRHLALERGSGLEMYVPIRQTYDYAAVDLVIRTPLSPASLASALRKALKPVEPNLPVGEFLTLQQLVDSAVSPRRFIVMLLAAFSAFALFLASLGIYGVIAYSVTQRGHEIGIRMALGASRGALQGDILLQTLKLALIGIVVGTAASWILTWSLRGMLFGVSATDPATFLGMIVILTVVALVAGYVPARRASGMDPLVALRSN